MNNCQDYLAVSPLFNVFSYRFVGQLVVGQDVGCSKFVQSFFESVKVWPTRRKGKWKKYNVLGN